MKHPKKWPVIRHIRCIYLSWGLQKWVEAWARAGIGHGWPNESDIQHLRDIWRGKA